MTSSSRAIVILRRDGRELRLTGTMADLRTGDEFESAEPPVYALDPMTGALADPPRLQRFTVVKTGVVERV